MFDMTIISYLLRSRYKICLFWREGMNIILILRYVYCTGSGSHSAWICASPGVDCLSKVDWWGWISLKMETCKKFSYASRMLKYSWALLQIDARGRFYLIIISLNFNCSPLFYLFCLVMRVTWQSFLRLPCIINLVYLMLESNGISLMVSHYFQPNNKVIPLIFSSQYLII